RPTLKNFSDLFLILGNSEVPVLRYLFNSILVTIITTVGTIFIATLGGYSMSKLKIPCKNFLFNLIVIAMTFPGAVTALPVFLIVREFGMYDTYWALIIPRFAGAYGLFLMKQFCDQLPVPILEAARIDGANELKVYTSIVLPFLRPAWGTLMVFTFTSVWGDSGSSIMYTINQNLRLFPVMLGSISEGGTLARVGATAAASLIMIIPSIIIFILQQRTVMETMAHSGIK
ncbi:MAG: carbohydrate ABC transporter permease, partial [Clostridia bacterium]|nr:carbohydrate ABC transporter permease [Clostridia bacterium]